MKILTCKSSNHRRLSAGAFSAIALLFQALVLGNLSAATVPGPINLSTAVFIGDSLTAGFRDGGLVDRYQKESIPALVMRQAGYSLTQPLIAWPGIPNVLQMTPTGPVAVGGTSTGRIDVTAQIRNFAVPRHTVKDALSTRPNLPVDSLTDLILGLPSLLQGEAKSQVEMAEAAKPSMVFAWLGAVDTLNGVLAGDPAAMTSESEFKANYEELVNRLTATGARVVLANIPPVTVIPFLVSAERFAAMAGIPVAALAPTLNVRPGDSILLSAVPAATAILKGQAVGPLADTLVITAAELATIEATVITFNSIIAAKAEASGAVLVDAHAALSHWHANGATIFGRQLTTAYMGGLFSNDGIHPSREGAIFSANVILKAINTTGANIPEIATTPINLSTAVFIGDSLTAGFRDGGLVDRYQKESIPALVMRQAGYSLTQPLIAWPGIPNVLQMTPTGPVTVGGTSTGRIDVTAQIRNFAVPRHTVKDALSTRPNLPVDSLTDLILGLPSLLQGEAKSQVEMAEAAKPSMVFAWLGAVDTLNGVLAGDPAAMTSESEFKANYEELVNRLTATGARVVLANIPPVTVIPFLVSAERFAAMAGIPVAALAPTLNVRPGDSILLSAVPAATAILKGQAVGPLADTLVITAAELATIEATVITFNSIIAAKAEASGAVLVDAHAALSHWHANGATIFGRQLTTAYMGGLFSNDGIHPSREGAIFSANVILKAINTTGANIPELTWVAVSRENGKLVVRWPSTAAGHTLQSSSTSAANSWQSVTESPVQDGATMKIELTQGSNHEFFRLVR